MKRQIHDNLVISTCFIVRFNSIILFSNYISHCFLFSQFLACLRIAFSCSSAFWDHFHPHLQYSVII